MQTVWLKISLHDSDKSTLVNTWLTQAEWDSLSSHTRKNLIDYAVTSCTDIATEIRSSD